MFEHLFRIGGRKLELKAESDKSRVKATAAYHVDVDDQVRAVGVAPIVVERGDVGMFQPRHQLRLGLEAADEIGLVG